MDILDTELQDVRRHCANIVPGSRVITSVREQVRVEIEKTSHKKLTVCAQFPRDYPSVPLVVELKSKTLSDKLLDGFSRVCNERAAKYLGKPQVIHIIKFISEFIDEHPLCVCSEEVSAIRERLNPAAGDELRLKQKTSSLTIKIVGGRYENVFKFLIPNEYPAKSVSVELKICHFPGIFQRWFLGQARELARQCTEPPLKRPTSKDKSRISSNEFKPKPSLLPVTEFLFRDIRRYWNEPCNFCKKQAFPDNPENAVTDEDDDMHVERFYCGHVAHFCCFLKYMKTPPFQGGKKCPSCGRQIYHEKYKLGAELSEARWAHQQARERELSEVVEFLGI